MNVAEKPGVLERLGGALNSGNLASVDDRIGAVDLIAALAYTQTNPDAAEHLPLDAAVIDPRTELASVLVRLKYGGDRVLGDRAALLLVHWVRHQKAYTNWKIKPRSFLLECFARQCLAEWLFPVCPDCDGRAQLGTGEHGEIIERKIRCTRCASTGLVKQHGVRRICLGCGGSGWKTHRRVRRTKPRACTTCMGTGLRRPNDAERVRALRVEHKTYLKHWPKRFAWLAAGLDRLDRLQKYCLQSQLRTGINRA